MRNNIPVFAAPKQSGHHQLVIWLGQDHQDIVIMRSTHWYAGGQQASDWAISSGLPHHWTSHPQPPTDAVCLLQSLLCVLQLSMV